MPDLSIVIVNYNTCDKLRECLTSIERERGELDIQTIVVDNGSRDGSMTMVRDEFPSVVLITPSVNTWFSGGNNIGVAHATAEIVYILNPDTIVQPNAPQTMLTYLHQNPHVGAVTCRMVYPDDGELQQTCSMLPQYPDLLLGYTFLGVIFSRWRDERRQRMWYADWQRDSNRLVEVAPGSNIMARRELLESFGVFDGRFKLYFTDDELCYEIKRAGSRVHFLADVTLYHYERSSVQQVQRLASNIYFDDLLTYCEKYFGRWRMWLLRLLMLPTRIGMNLAQRLRGERARL